MNIRKIAYSLLLSTLISCGQTQQKQEMTTTQYTQQDILDLYKTVKHFEEETHYGVRIKSANCNFQILINDKKVFATRRNKIGSVINGGYAPINYGILKSGLQSITVRMLPPVVDRKTEIKHPTLGNAQLDIEIVADDFMEGESTGEYSIYEWESPKETKFIKTEGIEMPYFTQPELPFFEHKSTFEAEVPYALDGWNKSVTLYTDDKEELEELTKEVLTIFEKLKLNFQEKKLDNLADMVYNKEKLASQQFYLRQSGMKENWNNYIEDYRHKGFKMMPIDNFQLVFYGNGKLVTLEHIGTKYQGESSLWSNYIKGNETGYSKTFYGFLLHRPQPDSELEII